MMWFVRGLQLLQLGVGQDEVEGGDCVADVVRFGGADDRRGDARPATQASATWAAGTCRSEAMRATSSTITRSPGR